VLIFFEGSSSIVMQYVYLSVVHDEDGDTGFVHNSDFVLRVFKRVAPPRLQTRFVVKLATAPCIVLCNKFSALKTLGTPPAAGNVALF
jgi:hypothetical protein